MTEITVKSLTGGEVAGTGLYDLLMRTSKGHLDAEYRNHRITDENYPNVYLGMMQANLSAANQFLLQYPITNKTLLLMDEQIAQAAKQNELLELQKEALRLANATAQYNLDVTLPKQSILLDSQEDQLEEQITLLGEQISQATVQVDIARKQENLLDEQIESEKDKTNTPTAGTNRATYDKILAEIAILEQKKLTEQKQTTGSVSDTGGLIGAELALKTNQADSFIRDAEQKVLKIMSDIFSVLYATEPEGLNSNDWGMGSDESVKVVTKAMAGINAGTPTQ